MAKLRGSGVDYDYAKGEPRGTLTIRVDGELVYQKKPGRDPENPEPTPEQFAEVTRDVLARAGVAAAIDDHEAAAFAAIHAAMRAKLLALVAAGELTKDGEKTATYAGAAGKRAMTDEEKALHAASA